MICAGARRMTVRPSAPAVGAPRVPMRWPYVPWLHVLTLRWSIAAEMRVLGPAREVSHHHHDHVSRGSSWPCVLRAGVAGVAYAGPAAPATVPQCRAAAGS